MAVSLRLAGLMHPDSPEKWQRYADMAAQALQRSRCLNVELSESDDIKLQGMFMGYEQLLGDCVGGHNSRNGATPLQQHRSVLDYAAGQSQPLPDSLSTWAQRASSLLDDVARAVLHAALRGVGLPAAALCSLLDDRHPRPGSPAASVLQCISHPAGPTNGSSEVASEATVDRGLLTVVWESAPGLQVRQADGKWLWATAGGRVAVFAGDMLQHATGGRIPAAQHRVVTDEPRVSLCFKLRAVRHGVIDLRGVPGYAPSDRYSHPVAVAQLNAMFDAVHCRSVFEVAAAVQRRSSTASTASDQQPLKQRKAAAERDVSPGPGTPALSASKRRLSQATAAIEAAVAVAESDRW